MCRKKPHKWYNACGIVQNMKKRILGYYNRIQTLLEEDNPETDWDLILQEHLVQVGFFQHERLIHLIVTVLFSLALFMDMIMMYISFNLSVILLGAALLILLVPYIMHYYLLENTVQKMYAQYDKIWAKVNRK